jgi:hypothetical protein
MSRLQLCLECARQEESSSRDPNGNTVLLFHGNNFAAFYFGGMIDALRKKGFRVIAQHAPDPAKVQD